MTHQASTPFVSSETKQRLEWANALTHGFGILFSVASIPVVTAFSTRVEDIPAIVGGAIYAFCFTMLFTFSTLYHVVQDPAAKRLLKVCDHISIYFMIAGTYTPFLLIYMLNRFGITLLSVLWSLAFIGIVFKIFAVGRFRVVSTLIYIAMGWILLVGGNTFFRTLPLNVLIMLAIGGVLYTLGAVFYLAKNIRLHHVIWHFFVLAAAICHYVAVLLAVLQSPARLV